MFSTYDQNNYNCSEGLLVYYDQEKVTATVGSVVTTKIKVTRHATKTYAFVFMTAEAAANCVTAKRSQYTRAFAVDTFDEDGITQATETKCMTDISSSVADNGARTVEISVNEEDVHYTSPSSGGEFVNNPASLFTTENQRDYDESVVDHKTCPGLSHYRRDRNLVVAQDLLVVYSAIRHKISSSTYWTEFSRHATKRMTYVGMSQETAEGCAATKLSQYTREYGYIDSSQTTNSERNKKRVERGAEVALRHNGLFWEVEISVNETDTKAAAAGTNPATLFASENGRNYEDGDDLDLTSVTLDEPEEGAETTEATVVAAFDIPDKTLYDCTFQYRLGASVEWLYGSVTWEDGTATGTVTGTCDLPVTDEDIFCRLTCYATESETIQAEKN